METALIVAIAQIATGMATLVVALFLAAQLLIQKRQLGIAHQDSVRELGFAARTRNEELILARLTNKSLLNSYLKVGAGLETPSDEETHQFMNYMRLSYLQMINEWRLGVNDQNVEYFKGRLGVLMGSVGERRYYLTNGKIIVGTVFGLSDLVNLGDMVYEELQGRPVPA
ncbi:MAG TPA: hypothetical protein EYN92_02240 [Dehalococcoidia bacterium]|jgi:hypothetical protein|nr:hypothetical protein [Dehalococcoidia bacterium]